MHASSGPCWRSIESLHCPRSPHIATNDSIWNLPRLRAQCENADQVRPAGGHPDSFVGHFVADQRIGTARAANYGGPSAKRRALLRPVRDLQSVLPAIGKSTCNGEVLRERSYPAPNGRRTAAGDASG